MDKKEVKETDKVEDDKDMEDESIEKDTEDKEEVKESIELEVDENLLFERIVPVFESKTAEISKESVSVLFEGTEFSDEFKTKASVIFEAALNARVEEAVESINEQALAVLAERVAEIEETLVEQLDSYTQEVVSEWVSENQVALEESIISEKAIDFVGKLKTLLEENNVFVTDESATELEEMAEAVVEAHDLLEAAEKENADLKATLFALETEKVFATVTEGLADSQVEKVKALLEGFEFNTVDEYKQKAEIVKEAFVSKTKSATTLTEETTKVENKTETLVEQNMSRYIAAAKRQKNT